MVTSVDRLNETSSATIYSYFARSDISLAHWYTHYFGGVGAGNLNHSTDDVPLDADHVGHWYKDSLFGGAATDARICKAIRDNVSRGWFSIGGSIVGAPSAIDEFGLANSYADTSKMFSYLNCSLFVTYSYICPEVNWTSPANGATDVNLSYLNLQFNISHPLGRPMNYTVYWHNYSTGDWDPIGGGSNKYNGTYSCLMTNNTNFNTYYEWKVYVAETSGTVEFDGYIMNITIEGDQIQETLINFPVSIRKVNNASFKDVNNGGQIQPNASDISFWNYDLTQRYYHEIEYYNGTFGNISAFVNVTKVTAGTDTIIRMLYGNGSTVDLQDSTKVWDGNYTAVWHMNDSYYIWDSTSNRYHQTGSSVERINITGLIGMASRLSGYTGGYYMGTLLPNVGDNIYTYEVWWNSSQAFDLTSRYLLRRGAFGAAGSGIACYSNPGVNDYEMFGYLQDTAANALDNRILTNTGMDNNAWRYTFVQRNPNSTMWTWTNYTWRDTSINAALKNCTSADNFSIGSLFYGGIDEVRISIGMVRNASWLNATYNNTNNSGFLVFGAGYYGVASGGESNATNYTFSFTTFDVEPPTDAAGTGVNSTAVNITYTEFPNHNGTTRTVAYFLPGYDIPAYGEGTLAGNSTDSYINYNGLTSAGVYTFALWTWWNDTHGMGRLSASYTYFVYVSPFGPINFIFRYENVTGGSGVDTNPLINFSWYPNCTHMLKIYYLNATSQVYYIDDAFYKANGNLSNFSFMMSSTPKMFEFYWNYTIWNHTTNCSYPRILTINTVVKDGTYNNLTFYMIADEDAGAEGPLIPYTFEFEDQTGLFQYGVNSTTTFYLVNSSGTRLVIEDRFWDVTNSVTAWLLYHKEYYVGFNATGVFEEYGQYYERYSQYSGKVKTTTTSQYATIQILPKVLVTSIIDNVYFEAGWLESPLGLYFIYNDMDNITTSLKITLFLNGSAIDWKNYTTTNYYLYNYSTAIHSCSYYITVVYIKEGKTISKIFPITAKTKTLTSQAAIELLLRNLFGDSPFFNADTGEEMPYTMIILFISGFVLMGFLVPTGKIELVLLAPGLLYAFAGASIVGIASAVTVAGTFLITIAIISSLIKGWQR